MAKRSKQRVQRPRPTKPAVETRPLPEARVTKSTGPREPAFWFGFEVTWAKLVRFRIAVFTLLAIDALLQFRHAPRYGAGNFNVGQLPLLDELGAGRIGYGTGQLVLAYLLILAAFGVATRAVLPIAAAVYAWLYFGSQLDSYQHHYLVSIVLVIACFVPWQRPVDARPETPVRSWALRVLLVELAIVYVWAAISKLDPAWVDGRTLAAQLTGWVKSLIDGTVGAPVVAIAIIGVELVLAATIWLKRTWFIAAPLGILFHLGIVATGFEIGVFAYLMVALYILVIPDRVWLFVDRYSIARWLAARMPELRKPWPVITGAAIAGIAVAAITRFEGAVIAAVILAIVPLLAAFRQITRGSSPRAIIGIAHIVAILAWLVVDRVTTVAVDYYKFWGGSQRRLDNKEQAERAYRRYVAVAPDDANARFQLGRLLLQLGDAEGLEHLHEAQRRDFDKARPFLEEARWLAKQNQLPEAIEVARKGAAAEPASSEARALVESLSRGGRATPSEADPRLDSDP